MEPETRPGAGGIFCGSWGLCSPRLAAVAVLVGIPADFAFGMGWFKAPREHMLGLVLGGIVLFFVMFVFFVVVAVVHVLTKDFVVPQMALEGIGAVEGWRRLWPMMQAEKGGYAGVRGHEDCAGDRGGNRHRRLRR